MNKEQEAVVEKARAKRKRRAAVKSAGKIPEEKPAPVAASNATLTEKAIDMVQGAAAQVGDFVKAAAHKITGTTAEVDPVSGLKNP